MYSFMEMTCFISWVVENDFINQIASMRIADPGPDPYPQHWLLGHLRCEPSFFRRVFHTTTFSIVEAFSHYSINQRILPLLFLVLYYSFSSVTTFFSHILANYIKVRKFLLLKKNQSFQSGIRFLPSSLLYYIPTVVGRWVGNYFYILTRIPTYGTQPVGNQ
jgi:hypothetical protein